MRTGGQPVRIPTMVSSCIRQSRNRVTATASLEISILHGRNTAARRHVLLRSNLYSKAIAMKKIAIIISVVLICLPTAVLAQAMSGSPGVPQAPIGHLQPRPAAPPNVQDRPSSGDLSRDDPARLARELRPSTERAIHSLCSYCLKPEGNREQR
jgi:hypothetical protein